MSELTDAELRILVTGDRKWVDSESVYRTLRGLITWVDTIEASNITQLFGLSQHPNKIILINGACRGADKLSTTAFNLLIPELTSPTFARKSFDVEEHPADWDKYGRAAGPVRNTEMAKRNPHIVIAFHDDITSSKGTKNMLNQVVDSVPLIVLVTNKDIFFYLKDDSQSNLTSKTKNMSELKVLLKGS